jgi:hypothetical protein
MTMITGYLLAAGAFFVALFIGSGLFGPLGFPAACAAAYFTWKHFADKYKKEMEALLNPPAELWKLSMEKSWSCLHEALADVYVQTATSGRAQWQVTTQDPQKGRIGAQISFTEQYNEQPLPRTVQLHAEFAPDGSNTSIKITCQLFAVSGPGLAKAAIENLMTTFRGKMAAIGGTRIYENQISAGPGSGSSNAGGGPG